MRYAATVLVALMLVFAGCNTGGGGGTPAANQTNPSVEASAVPGVNGTQLTNVSAIATPTFEALSGNAELNVSFDSDSESGQLRYLNDTEQQLYEISGSQGAGEVYYVDGEQAAVRNATTGEIRYSSTTNNIGSQAAFSLLFAAVSISQIEYLHWEAAGTTTIDGETHYVFEADSVNETALNQPGVTFSPDNVTAVNGRLVVGTDGVAHEGSISIETDETITTSFSLDTSGDVEVTAPSWYDESQAS